MKTQNLDIKQPDINDFQRVDRHAPEIKRLLEEEGIIYKKFAKVKAEIAGEDRLIETILNDGLKETRNNIRAGDVIITNPDGEQYSMDPIKFSQRYSYIEEEDRYQPKGMVVAIRNPFETNIIINASWGEDQLGDVDCIIVDTYDPNTGEIRGEPYIIGRNEFHNTYKSADEPETASFPSPLPNERPSYVRAVDGLVSHINNNPLQSFSFYIETEEYRYSPLTKMVSGVEPKYGNSNRLLSLFEGVLKENYPNIDIQCKLED